MNENVEIVSTITNVTSEISLNENLNLEINQKIKEEKDEILTESVEKEIHISNLKRKLIKKGLVLGTMIIIFIISLLTKDLNKLSPSVYNSTETSSIVLH